MTGPNGQEPLDPALDLSLIGASDMPVIAGVSPYGSQAEIYNRLRYQIAAVRSHWLDTAGRIGRRCEHGIASVAAEELGRDPRRLVKPPSVVRPGGLRWARCSLDPYLPADQDGPPLLFEIKMRTRRSLESQGWGEPGTGEVAPDVYVQVQAQLALMALVDGVPRFDGATVVVCVEGQSLRLYPVPRAPDVGEQLIDLAEQWWERHIEGGEPVPLDGSESTALALARRFPVPRTQVVRSASAHEAFLVARLAETGKRLEEAKRAHELAKQEVQAVIADDVGLEAPGYRVRWAPRRGRVNEARMVDDLVKRLGLAPGDRKILEEQYRGESYRWLDLRTVEDEHATRVAKEKV